MMYEGSRNLIPRRRKNKASANQDTGRQTRELYTIVHTRRDEGVRHGQKCTNTTKPAHEYVECLEL